MYKNREVNLYDNEPGFILPEGVKEILVSWSIKLLDKYPEVRTGHFLLAIKLAIDLVEKFFLLWLALLLIFLFLFGKLLYFWCFFSLNSLDLHSSPFVLETFDFFHDLD